MRLNEASEDLCGTSSETSAMRTMHAVAALRDWAVGSGDVGGAHQTAPQRSPSTYVRLPPDLRGPDVLLTYAMAVVRGPCYKLEWVTSALQTCGFGWVAHCEHFLLSSQLGWGRLRGISSASAKQSAMLAVHVDDLVPAGRPLAGRREWAALHGKLLLRGKPETLSRFLGAKHQVGHKSKRIKVLLMMRQKLIVSDDEVAP